MTGYSLADLGSDCVSLVKRSPSIWAVWGRKRIDPDLREEVMVAVAEAVGCRFCTFTHREMILNSGGSVRALAEFEGEEEKTDRVFTAIVWAQLLVENDFRAATPQIEREFHERFSESERDDLITVALAMKLMSSCGHQADALVSRLKGKPTPGSRLGDELIMATLYFPPAAIVYAALMAKRKDARAFGRDFRTFSKRFAEE